MKGKIVFRIPERYKAVLNDMSISRLQRALDISWPTADAWLRDTDGIRQLNLDVLEKFVNFLRDQGSDDIDMNEFVVYDPGNGHQ